MASKMSLQGEKASCYKTLTLKLTDLSLLVNLEFRFSAWSGTRSTIMQDALKLPTVRQLVWDPNCTGKKKYHLPSLVIIKM